MLGLQVLPVLGVILRSIERSDHGMTMRCNWDGDAYLSRDPWGSVMMLSTPPSLQRAGFGSEANVERGVR